MNYSLYKEETYNNREWAGGETKELSLFPEDAEYERKNFIWRLSSDVVTQEEAAFSKLPDYDRVLMVLEGDAVLAYEGERVVRLKELEQDRFDGGFSARCFGKMRDYNLMVRKGCAGHLDVIELTSEKQEPECEDSEDYGHICQAFYCHDGYGIVTFGDQTCMVEKGRQLVIRYDPEEPMTIGVMGEGTLIRAQIFYSDMVLSEQEIQRERGTFADFTACMKLSLTNFRGSRYFFRSLREVWYDERLKRGIRKIERFYLPMFIWFVGLGGVGVYGAVRWQSWSLFCAMAAWTLLMLFVLSPFMYFLAVPKPVRAHIKKTDSLTEYEKSVRRAEMEANPAADRFLKKYKISGHKVYVEKNRPRG